MLLYTAISIISSFALSLFLVQSPLTLGLWLVIIALGASILIFAHTSKWFAILLFLVYVGGLLVIFAYFSAISPNQLTEIKIIFRAALISFLFIQSSLFIFIKPSFLSSTNLSLPSIQFIICSPNAIPIVALVVTLFITIIIVIKVSTRQAGPLRPFISRYSLIKH